MQESNFKAILVVVIMVSSMIFLDQTILPVALPTIQKQFLSSEIALQWMVNTYLLVLAVLALAGGRLADIYDHKKVFNLGLAIFGLSSFICGISIGSVTMIIGRVIQGIGAALMLPSLLPILFNATPKNKVGSVMGLQVSFSSIFLIVGPFIGGAFTQYLSWRYAFFINIPLCLVAYLMSSKYIISFSKKEETFDFWGFLVISFSIACVTIAIMQAKVFGWGSWPIITLLLVGIFLLGALRFTEKWAKHPFIDFSLFKHTQYRKAAFNLFSMGFALMVSIFWAIYLQKIMELEPFYAGTFTMISSLPIIFISPIAGRIYDLFGFKVPAIGGEVLVIVSLIAVIFILPFQNILLLLTALLFMSIGVVGVFNSSFSHGISVISNKKKGAASGVLTMFRSLGPVLGVAIMGSVSTGVQQYLFKKELIQNPATQSIDPSPLEGLLADSEKAFRVLHSFSSDLQTQIITNLKSSATYAFMAVNLTAALIMLFALVHMTVKENQ
jgi:EmrB/QacA subfamily drug resistance transporter